MENAIRNRRAHFSLLFCSKLDLRLSWRHLRSILGRLGNILSRLGFQLGSNLDLKMVLELPISDPTGAYHFYRDNFTFLIGTVCLADGFFTQFL